MSKLSKQQKLELYRKWKHEGYSFNELSCQENLSRSTLTYLLKLIDKYGAKILDQPNKKYSKEFKEAAIARVLKHQESGIQISLELGLRSRGMLVNWVREYKENGYNVVIRKKGRPSAHDKEQKEVAQGTGSRGQAAEAGKLRAAYQKLLYKKTKRLGSETSEEIAQAITELRQEEHLSYDQLAKIVTKDQSLPWIARSTYYYTLSKKTVKCKRPALLAKINHIFEHHKGRYGYRRIALQMRREGSKVTDRTVRYWMHKVGLKGIRRNKRKYSSYKGTIGKIAPNLIKRNFFAIRPNMKWYTDITEFHLHGQKLYLSPILDGCAGDIVAYSISRHPDMHLVISMLHKAFKKHPALNALTFHSDQGCQYQSSMYQHELKLHGITQSMSRKGNSPDDGLMENFFGLLKTEMFYGQEYKYHSLKQLKEAIEKYIKYYNEERIKSRLKGLTPNEYRNQALMN